MLTLPLLLALGCGTDNVRKVEGLHGRNGKDGRDGKDGKDLTSTVPVPLPTRTAEPVPRPTTGNTDVIIVLNPPYPNCNMGECPPQAIVACVCLNGEWQTVYILKREMSKYNLRNLGQCYYGSSYELNCAPTSRKEPLQLPRSC
jgi:hypothetical protein